jgi:starch synthase
VADPVAAPRAFEGPPLPGSILTVHIAMVASECEPYAKTGGLADVVDGLARELGRQGHDVDVYLPFYRGVQPPEGATRTTFGVPRGADPAQGPDDLGDVATVDLVSGQASGYRIRLVDHPYSFARRGYYGEGGSDYPDNAARFALLGRTALEAVGREGRPLDILHGHDWQAGPALLLQRHRYADNPLVSRAGSVLTCHNLAYHGWVPRAVAWQLDLPERVGGPTGVDLLREGIAIADLVNTVSPTYAEESRGPEFGAGLDDLLRSLGDRYIGILNGLDQALWDPATDAALAARYSADDPGGKAICKRDLASRLGLEISSPVPVPATSASRPTAPEATPTPWDERGGPLFGMIGRLDPMKGFDLVTAAAPTLLNAGARLVVLGTGDHTLVSGLQDLAAQAPDRLALLERFDRDEARRIYAGADIFLMPSRFEPSGQGQMISLRYGTLPLVRRTGGLADTVRDVDAEPAHGNGFVFSAAEPAALIQTAERAIRAYRDGSRWSELVRRGMREDFSWARPAAQYVAAYERAVELRKAGGASALRLSASA